MISLCMDSAYKALVLGLYKDGTLVISKKRFTINPNIVKSYTIDSYGKKPWREECKLIKKE